MKPSDFQKTVQCRFESCLKKVVRSVVKDYYKELNRRKNKEISFSELPDVLVDKMAVWDCKFCSNGTPILKSAVHSF